MRFRYYFFSSGILLKESGGTRRGSLKPRRRMSTWWQSPNCRSFLVKYNFGVLIFGFRIDHKLDKATHQSWFKLSPMIYQSSSVWLPYSTRCCVVNILNSTDQLSWQYIPPFLHPSDDPDQCNAAHCEVFHSEKSHEDRQCKTGVEGRGQGMGCLFYLGLPWIVECWPVLLKVTNLKKM